MQANFMPLGMYLFALVWKRFDRVTWNEPSRPYVLFTKQLEHSLGAKSAGVEATRDVARGILAAVGAQPAGDGVQVDAIADSNPFVCVGRAHG